MCRSGGSPEASSARSSPDRALALGQDIVDMDRLEVDLASEEEVAVRELRHRVEGALEREPDRVLDEARLQVRVLDDEQLVGPLQQLVDRSAHRTLHDRDQVVRIQLTIGSDIEGSLAALVMGRERDELEDAIDVLVACLGQALGSAAADEPLRTRAGVDPCRLDADDAAHAGGRRGRDPDERDHLLRRELADGCRPADRPARCDSRFGAKRALAADDVLRDVLGQRLDVQRFSADNGLDRLLEELGEARHVDALLLVREVDRALDLGRHHGLVAFVADAHRLLDAGHAGAGERQPHVGSRGLEIGVDA